MNFCQQLQTEGIILIAGVDTGTIYHSVIVCLAIQPLEAIVRRQRPIYGRSVNEHLGRCRRLPLGPHLSQPPAGGIFLHGYAEGVPPGDEPLPIDGRRQQPLVVFGQPLICRLRWRRRTTDAHEDLEVGVLGRILRTAAAALLLLPLVEQVGQLSLHFFFVGSRSFGGIYLCLLLIVSLFHIVAIVVPCWGFRSWQWRVIRRQVAISGSTGAGDDVMRWNRDWRHKGQSSAPSTTGSMESITKARISSHELRSGGIGRYRYV